DIHMVIEAALIERIGEPGRKLHTGRSRNDQVAMDLILWLQSAFEEISGKLSDLQKSFVSLAERSRDVVMPSYTHLQRAQPISAGSESLAWAMMFWRDRDRNTRFGWNAAWFVPLGSGAIAGTSLKIEPIKQSDEGSELPDA